MARHVFEVHGTLIDRERVVARPFRTVTNFKLLTDRFAGLDLTLEDFGMPVRLVLNVGLETLHVDIIALFDEVGDRTNVDLEYTHIGNAVRELAVFVDRAHAVDILKA